VARYKDRYTCYRYYVAGFAGQPRCILEGGDAGTGANREAGGCCGRGGHTLLGAMGQDIARFITEIDPEAALVGHSLGMDGLKIATSNPGLLGESYV